MTVHARPLPGRIVVRSLAGDERIIVPKWDCGQYEIGHLARQLFLVIQIAFFGVALEVSLIVQMRQSDF